MIELGEEFWVPEFRGQLGCVAQRQVCAGCKPFNRNGEALAETYAPGLEFENGGRGAAELHQRLDKICHVGERDSEHLVIDVLEWLDTLGVSLDVLPCFSELHVRLLALD